MEATLNTAADLAIWLREELAVQPDGAFALRVIARETTRWLALLPADAHAMVDSAPESTGDLRWDALLEGVAAYRMHQIGVSSPEWCRRTRLDENFDPTPATHATNNSVVLDLFETPAELMDKGVLLSRRALVSI